MSYICICNAQTNWKKIPIDSNVSVSFPGIPVKKEPSITNRSFIFKQADSSANYIVAATNVGPALGMNATALAAQMEKKESWEQIKIAFMKSLGQDATLIKDEMTQLKNTTALRLVVNRKLISGEKNTLTVLIFVYGTTSYNIIFSNRESKGSDIMKEQFFNSIEIK